MGKGKTTSTKQNIKSGRVKRKITPMIIEDYLEKHSFYSENTSVMFYAYEEFPTHKTFSVSPSFETLGYPLEEWKGGYDFWRTIVHPDDLPELLRKASESAQNRESTDFTYRMITKSGEIRWFHDKTTFVIDPITGANRWQGIIIDVTAQKVAEEELGKMAAAYKTIVHHIPDSAIFIFDKDLKYTLVEGIALESHGVSSEMLEGKTVYDFYPEHLAETWASYYRAALAGGYLYFEHKQNERFFQVHILPVKDNDGKIYAGLAMLQDITIRKSQEIELTNSEAKYRELFENANDLVYVHDLEGNYSSINKAAEKVFGYTSEEAMNLNVSQIISPEHLEFVKEKIKQKLLNGSDKTTYEVDCIAKDGRKVLLEVNSRAIYKDGKIVGIQGIARDISERKRTEIELKLREEQYHDLFENANDIIYTTDLEGNLTSINRAGEELTGYSRVDVLKGGFNMSTLLPPKDLKLVKGNIKKKLLGVPSTQYEINLLKKNGESVLLELNSRLILKDGKPIGLQGIARDIAERKRTEDALVESERRYRMLSEGIMHHVWTASPDGIMDYMNKRGLSYHGLSEVSLNNNQWKEQFHPDDFERIWKAWGESVKTGTDFEVEFRSKRYDGVYRWFRTTATAGRDAEYNIIKWFGTSTDIHDKKTAEAKLSYFAKSDTLTKLPNRVEFMNQLLASIVKLKANDSTKFAVLFLDIDRFKVINDSLGHIIGDKLLCIVAARLKACVRPKDVVARLGGDEFTILINQVDSDADVTNTAQRIQNKLSLPFKIDNYEIFTSASIGIVISDGPSRQPEDFLRDADTAMYSAKEKGKARFEIFNSEMHTQNLNLLQMENDLRRAIERNEFKVHYQPIINLVTGKIEEFEALIRWEHPEKGLIQPINFIGVAEETGMIIPIGEWILTESCRQTLIWQKKYPGNSISISVNLSAKQLMHPDLIAQIETSLRKTSLNPLSLKLEVTESMVMKQADLALDVLKKIANLGVSLSTDDFGTGYSSLSYLHRFPFNRLKIDRSFIGQMDSSTKSLQIVKSILSLATNLGFDVVAEGIETSEQLERLQEFGCEFGQGYLFSKPVDAIQAEELLSNAPEYFVPFDVPKQIDFLETHLLQ